MSNIAAIARFFMVSNKCHACSKLKALGLKILVSAVRFRLRAPRLRYIPTYKCTLVRTSSSLKHECTPTSVSVSLALLLVADHVTQGATREMFTMVLSSCTSTLLGSQRSSRFRIYFQLILQTIHQSDQLPQLGNE